MFTVKHRNARIKAAYVRAARAEVSARQAQAAIERAKEVKAELEWLKNSPVKDGTAGEGLPTQEELDQYLAEVRAKVRKNGKDDEVDGQLDTATRYDDQGNVIS